MVTYAMIEVSCANLEQRRTLNAPYLVRVRRYKIDLWALNGWCQATQYREDSRCNSHNH